jgi:hypothetical protein
MTLPLAPAPSLSPDAQPFIPADLPELGPDHARAAAAMVSQSVQAAPVMRERDLRERDLLGMAMASEHGVRALRDLEPREFVVAANRNVAQAILDLDRLGQPHDAAAVTAELATRPIEQGLPVELRAEPSVLSGTPRQPDPRESGLGAWQTTALATETRAPILAREIRSLYRQDALQEIAQAAVAQWKQGLEFDVTGRMEADRLGEVTLNLANRLVSLPQELHPEWGVDTRESVDTWANGPTRSASSQPTPSGLDLPSPPRLSAQGLRAIHAR